MSQNDFTIANASGATVRADLNDALAALVGQNSGATAPATTFAYMLWADTANGLLKQRNAANSAWVTVGTMAQDYLGLRNILASATDPTTMYAYMMWIDTDDGILRIRNAANNAWVQIGAVASANLGLLPLSGGTMSGILTSSNTTHWKIPVGTTAQRDGSPADGMIRYNSDLTTFEGYGSAAWAPIGGGGFIITAVESISAGGNIASSTTVQRQMRHVQGNAAAVNASITPFGTGANWKDGAEVRLIGNSNSNTVTLTFNDAANGVVGNFETVELWKYRIADLVYSASLGRWVLVNFS